MTTYVEHQHTNPDGQTVTIWLHEKFDRASIGAWASIGAGARIGAWARIGDRTSIGAWARIGEGASIGADDDTLFPIYIASLPDGPKNYCITITAKTMAIGCQIHPLADWFAFDDERILEMDGRKALVFWRRYKRLLLAIAADAGWLSADALAPSEVA